MLCDSSGLLLSSAVCSEDSTCSSLFDSLGSVSDCSADSSGALFSCGSDSASFSCSSCEDGSSSASFVSSDDFSSSEDSPKGKPYQF